MLEAGCDVDNSVAMDIDEGALKDCMDFAREVDEEMKLKTSIVKVEGPQVRELMGLYYDRYFPAKHMMRWLAYGNSGVNLSKREFSFTLPNDAYWRFQSFDNADSFHQTLIRERPAKIDIGSVYSSRPSERKTLSGVNFVPLQRELVFDIDMTDYDDVRTCCQETRICWKCWKFLAVAAKIIDSALREDFGFTDIMWVFSGRRGIHCWVSDPRARRLSSGSRKSIVSYLDIPRNSGQNNRVILPFVIPATMERSIEFVKESFADIALKEQEILGSPTLRQKIIGMIPDAECRAKLASAWSDDRIQPSSQSLVYWEIMEQLLHQFFDGNSEKLLTEIMVTILYPRLDVNVTTHLNHLIKAPFCVHPSTGNLCIPMSIAEIENFDPDTVVNVKSLCADRDGVVSTRFIEYVRTFEKYAQQCEEHQKQEDLQIKRDVQDQSLQF